MSYWEVRSEWDADKTPKWVLQDARALCGLLQYVVLYCKRSVRLSNEQWTIVTTRPY